MVELQYIVISELSEIMIEWRDDMIQRLLIQFVVICCVFVGITSAAQAQMYSDVSDDTFITNSLKVLSEQGIITENQDTAFRLNDTLTRYEAAEFIVKALKIDLTASKIHTYKDINEEDARMPIVSAITELGIMTGNASGNFNPDGKLTRAQAVIFLAQAFNLKGQAIKTFNDVPVTSSAAASIQGLVENNIIFVGKQATFRQNAKMLRSDFVMYLARILDPTLRQQKPDTEEATQDNTEGNNQQQPVQPQEPKQNPSCERETGKKTYLVDVSVTNFWNQRNQSRTVDNPSTLKPVKLDTWVSSMNLSQKKWLVGRTDTQALFGDKVTVLAEQGNWLRVAAKDQYVPYLKAGYPGWVSKRHITYTTKNYDDCSIAIVTAKKTTLMNTDQKTKYLEISYATILPVIKEDNQYYHVQTPSAGIKLLKKSESKSYKKYSDVPKPTASTIVNEAKRYLNLPYLWAGISSWGYDCSGILYAVFRTHGIMIPRDSFYQATGGKAVAKKNLQAGDLVFFAYNNGKGKVYHVGLYIGNGQMLHAPHYASKVKIEPLFQGVYKKNYSGARRYL